jgi:group I intron endonuclease
MLIRTMERIYFIYVTTNLISGKKYIGYHSTYDLNDGYLGSGIALLDSFKKYGKNNFQKEVLEFIKEGENHLEYEEKWIKELNTLLPNGYNISPKGGLGIKGSLSEESKKKISKSNKGKQVWLGKSHSMESKKKISKSTNVSGELNPFYGKKHSDESILKIKEKSGKNYPKSEEHKKNISKGKKGKESILSEEGRKKISEATQLMNKKRIKCPICDKEFNPGNYGRHKKTKHLN